MDDVPDAPTQLHSVLKFYVNEFRKNQEFFKAHLKGISCNEPTLLPAFLPPSSYWTSAEKDLFFHGLSVYSRLQPELIAQHVKTKSTFDICVYLEVLKAAAESMEEEENSEAGSLRAEMEYAMEVSEKWVVREESIAESLMALDACPCSLEGSGSRLAETCTCRSTSDGDSQGVADYEMPPKCFNNNLNHLDPTCLMVLEMIHRKGGNENHPDDAQSLGEDRQNSVLNRQGSLPGETNPPSELTETASQKMTISGSRDPSPLPDKAQLRRMQKRLYMRRKRAEAVGKAANTDAIKLRPGRPTKQRKPAKPRPKTYKPRKGQPSNQQKKGPSPMDSSQNGDENDDLEVDEDAQSSVLSRRSPSYQQEDSEEEDEESTYEKHTKGGLTRPYKLKKSFHESGLAAQTLSEMDMDFFNLTELGRLLRFNNALNAPSRKRDAISISVECIQLFREMVKEFSSKVIQRAIIMKEQEIRLKADLKVWKYDRQEISVENMLECLKTMEFDQLTKEQYFSDLVGGDNEEGFSEEMSDEELTASDDHSAFESEGDSSAPESLPSNSMRSESLHPLPSPSPSPSSPPLFNLIYCDLLEGDILSSDVDEVRMTKELAEEDILDVFDIVQSKKYEKNLWKTHR